MAVHAGHEGGRAVATVARAPIMFRIYSKGDPPKQ
jgi:hypothetical protein